MADPRLDAAAAALGASGDRRFRGVVDYSTYLRTRWWAGRKRIVRDRARSLGYERCEHYRLVRPFRPCLRRVAEVHHRAYDLGRENPRDLLGVCIRHHRWEEKHRPVRYPGDPSPRWRPLRLVAGLALRTVLLVWLGFVAAFLIAVLGNHPDPVAVAVSSTTFALRLFAMVGAEAVAAVPDAVRWAVRAVSGG